MRYFAGFDINDTKTITYFAQPPGLGYLILLFLFKRIDKKNKNIFFFKFLRPGHFINGTFEIRSSYTAN